MIPQQCLIDKIKRRAGYNQSFPDEKVVPDNLADLLCLINEELERIDKRLSKIEMAQSDLRHGVAAR